MLMAGTWTMAPAQLISTCPLTRLSFPSIHIRISNRDHYNSHSNPHIIVIKHSIFLFVICLILSSDASAQGGYIWPWRDFVPVQSTNSTPAAGADKSGYASISKENGRFWYYYLPDYLIDSLQMDTVFADKDFLKLDGVSIPNHTDSMSHDGYMLLKGLYGGLATKIEFLKEGILQFDQAAGINPKHLIKFRPLQQDQGNTDFVIGIYSGTNAGAARNNDVFSMGWNLDPGGGPVVLGKSAFGIHLEGYYHPGSQETPEFHVHVIDSLGVQHRGISYVFKPHDLTAWEGNHLVNLLRIRDPVNDGAYVSFIRDGVTGSSMYLNGSSTGVGAYLAVDPTTNNMSIVNLGMTFPTLTLNSFTRTEVDGLSIGTLSGTSTTILGREAGSNYVGSITDGYGITLSGGSLDIDTTVIATQHDVTSVVDHDWHEEGTSTPPNSISDNIYKPSGYVGIGTPTPGYALDVTGQQRILDNQRPLLLDNTGYVLINFRNDAGSNYWDLGKGGSEEFFLGDASTGQTLLSSELGSNFINIHGATAAASGSGGVDILGMFRPDNPGNAYGQNARINMFRYEDDLSCGALCSRTAVTFKLNHSTGGSFADVLTMQSNGNVGIGNTSPAQTLHVTGTARITGSSGIASTLTGMDPDGDINRVTPGAGLELIDNALNLISPAPDSVLNGGQDTLCFVQAMTGDTVCVPLDSVTFEYDPEQICFIYLGDTTCYDINQAAGNIYTLSSQITPGDQRVVEQTHTSSLTFRRIETSGVLSNALRIMFADATSSVSMGLNSNSNTTAILSLNNPNSGSIYQHWNGFGTDEDYCIGINKTANTFVFSEGNDIGLGTGEPFLSYHGGGDSTVFHKDVQFDAKLLDEDGDAPSVGDVATGTATGFNWAAPTAAGAIPINDLLAADGTNTIDNAAYTQEWQWNTLAGNAGLKLSSTSTASTGDDQKVLEVALSGANTNDNEITHAGYFTNTHTGTGSTNIAVYGSASGGSFNIGVDGVGSSYGVRGTSVNGTGVYGTSTNGDAVYGYSPGAGAGVYGQSNSGAAVSGTTVTGLGGTFTNSPASTSTVSPVLQMSRLTSGTAANGIGASFRFNIEDTGGSGQTATTLESSWTDATNATRTSAFTITGVNSAVSNAIITFEGDKRTRFLGRAEETQGADVASVAGAITLGMDGNAFEITGTNAITLISNVGWQNGSKVTLLFTSTASLVNGTATSGTNITLKLAGAANFNATADDTITLMLSEIGGTQAWREVSRSVN